MKKFTLAILTLLFVFAFTVFVSAVGIDKVTLHSPTNASYDTDGSVVFIFNVTGNATAGNYTCVLWWNSTGTWATTTNVNSNVNNDTRHNVTETGISDKNVIWNMGCNITTNGSVVFASNNLTFTVDSVAPVIQSTSPLNSSWHTNGQLVNFSINVTEANADTCILETNLNESANRSTTWNLTAESLTYSAGTRVQVNFLFGYNKAVVKWDDNNTGNYLWNVRCNDSAGQSSRWGNTTFFVDSVSPTQPNLTTPTNNTKSTDYTVLLGWLQSTELNFSYYWVMVDNDSGFGSPEYQLNITSRTANATNVTSGNLSGDVDYFINVTAFDLAGNSQTNARIPYTYRTDSTCHTLIANSWNVCVMIRTTPINASDLCTETSCTFISLYNASHAFQTYTSGASVNGNMMFSSAARPNESSIAFIYVESTNKTWESQVWQISNSEIWFNLTNASTGYNLVPMLKQSTTTLGAVDFSINGDGNGVNFTNVSKFMTFYNPAGASGSRYSSHIRNWTLYNNTPIIDYGEAVWVHLNTTVDWFVWNSSGEI